MSYLGTTELCIAIILLALSSWQIAETISSAELFRGLRGAIQRLDNSVRFPVLRLILTPIFSMTCQYCLVHWVGLAFTFFLIVNSPITSTGFLFVTAGFTVIRLATLGNIILAAYSQGPDLKAVASEDLEQELLKRNGT